MISAYLEAAVFIALPAIVAMVASIFSWANLEKPWLFALVSVVALYVLYVAVLYLIPGDPGHFLEASNPNRPSATPEPTFVFIGAYFKAIAIYLALAAPLAWGLAKMFHSPA